MTDDTPKDTPKKPSKPTGYKSHAKPHSKPGSDHSGDADKPHPGDRIAKVLSRAGISSRREAEELINEGRVTVNGRKVVSPALNVMPKDRIYVDGKEVGEPEPPRVWLYHKPLGLVTTAKDEKGRETVFDKLPVEMPRVMSVGRLDINSEGLLLLTNDGEVKRKLELPDTGWLRKYRVRVKGTASEATLDTLRNGITIDGEDFQGMEVTFDRQQGANAWLTVGLREGKNREIRRAMEHIGLVVNRLIRLSYGPFRLGTLQPGQVEEVRARVLRDQLGMDLEVGDGGFSKRGAPQGAKRAVSRDGKPGGPRTETKGRNDARAGSGGGDRRADGKAPFKPRGDKPAYGDRDDRSGGKPGGKPRGEGGFKSRDDRDGKPGGKPGGFKRRDDAGGGRPEGGFKKRDGDSRGDFKSRSDSRGDSRGERDGKPAGRPFGKPGGKLGGKPGSKPGGFKSAGFKSHGGGAEGKPRSSGFKSHASKPGGKPPRGKS
jgi:23S rRNA pseudouridine2605 synthase